MTPSNDDADTSAGAEVDTLAAEPPTPDIPTQGGGTATTGCLRAVVLPTGNIAVEKTSSACNCSMDLADLAPNHAKDIVQILDKVTRNL